MPRLPNPGGAQVTDDEIKDARTWLASVAGNQLYEERSHTNNFALEARDGWAAALDEVERLRGLFDAAGQGEHNVLGLVDHYQEMAIQAADEADALRGENDELLEEVDGLRAHSAHLRELLRMVRPYLFAAATDEGAMAVYSLVCGAIGQIETRETKP